MLEVILCPNCSRRLRKPTGIESGEVVCPSCSTRFSIESARAASAEAPSPSEPTPPSPVTPRPPEMMPTPKPIPVSRPLPRPRIRKPVPDEMPSSRAPRIIAIGIIFGIFSVIAIICSGIGDEPRLVPIRDFEVNNKPDLQAIFQDILKKRAGAAGNIPAEPHDPLGRFFHRLGDSLRNGTSDTIQGHFDLERFRKEMNDLGLVPGETGLSHQEQINRLNDSFGLRLTKHGIFFVWNSTWVGKVHDLPNGEKLVYCIHQEVGGVFIHARWWLRPHGNGFKAYDFEDFDMGLRLSVAMGREILPGPRPDQGITGATAALSEAAQKVFLHNDLAAGENSLKRIEGQALPEHLTALRFFIVGLIEERRQNWQGALDAFEKSAAKNPDFPCATLAQGVCLTQLGKHDQALAVLKTCQGEIGDDAITCDQIGVCLSHQRRFDEAAAYYRKALDQEPDRPATLLSLLQSLNFREPRDEILVRFRKLKNGQQHFAALIEECRLRRDGQSMRLLAEEMAKIAPDEKDLELIRALGFAWSKQPDEAYRLLRDLLAMQRDLDTKNPLFESLVQSLCQGRHAANLISLLPEPDGFRLVALGLLNANQLAKLRPLLDARMKTHPDDPLAHLINGEFLARRQQFKAAHDAFTRGTQTPKEKQRALPMDRFQHWRVQAAFKSGNGLEAYRTITPRDRTLEDLLNLCRQDRDWGLYEQLLILHAQSDPDDSQLLRDRYRLHLWQGHELLAAAAFREYLAGRATGEDRARANQDLVFDAVDSDRPWFAYRWSAEPRQTFQSIRFELEDQGKVELLASVAEVHRLRDPNDPRLAIYDGEQLMQQERYAEAAALLEKAYAQSGPDLRPNIDNSLAVCQYRIGKGVHCLEMIAEEDRPFVFRQLFDLSLSDKSRQGMVDIVEAYRRLGADDAKVGWCEALVLLEQGKTNDACTRLVACLAKVDQAFPKDEHLRSFTRAAVRLGQADAVFPLLKDQPKAFDMMAQEYLFKKSYGQLEKLVAIQEAKDPKNPSLLRYQLELMVEQGKAGEAYAKVKDELKAKATDVPWELQSIYRKAAVKSGKVVEVYREPADEMTNFANLAQECRFQKLPDAMESLLAEHRKADPDDPLIEEYELDVPFLRKEYVKVLERLDGQKKQPAWRELDLKLRCLLRLGRNKEALTEAEAQDQKKGQANRMLVFTAHAQSGGPKAAEAFVIKHRLRDWWFTTCLSDDDAGPLLRSDAFADFRKKFGVQVD